MTATGVSGPVDVRDDTADLAHAWATVAGSLTLAEARTEGGQQPPRLCTGLNSDPAIGV